MTDSYFLVVIFLYHFYLFIGYSWGLFLPPDRVVRITLPSHQYCFRLTRRDVAFLCWCAVKPISLTSPDLIAAINQVFQKYTSDPFAATEVPYSGCQKQQFINGINSQVLKDIDNSKKLPLSTFIVYLPLSASNKIPSDANKIQPYIIYLPRCLRCIKKYSYSCLIHS